MRPRGARRSRHRWRADSAEAHYNRAKALPESRDLNGASVSYSKAIELDPEFAAALSNLGSVPDSLLRLDEALAQFDRALELLPDFPDAAANKGMRLLRQARFDPGSRFFEQRKNGDEYAQWRAARSYPQKVWTGDDDLAGKTLFVYWEQGLGDTIMFSRFLLLAERRTALAPMIDDGPTPVSMALCGGGSSIRAHGCLRSSASLPPRRRWVGNCGKRATASSPPGRAIMRKRRQPQAAQVYESALCQRLLQLELFATIFINMLEHFPLLRTRKNALADCFSAYSCPKSL